MLLCGRPMFGFQHPRGGLQPSLMPVPGYLVHSSEFCGYWAYMWYTYINPGKIPRHIRLNKCLILKGTLSLPVPHVVLLTVAAPAEAICLCGLQLRGTWCCHNFPWFAEMIKILITTRDVLVINSQRKHKLSETLG